MKFYGDFCRYGRVEITLDDAPDRLEITAPSGEKHTVYSFKYQPVEIVYDSEGFEDTRAVGKPFSIARFTPLELGRYIFEAYCGDRLTDGDTLYN